MAKGQSPEKQKPAKQENKTEKVKKDDWHTIANKDIKHKDTKVTDEKEDKRRSNPTKPPPRGPPPSSAPRNDHETPTSQKFSSGKTNSAPPPRGKQVAAQYNINNNNQRHEEIKDQKVGPKILINPNVAITSSAPKALSYVEILKLHSKPPPPAPVVHEEEVEEHVPEADPLPEHATYAQTASHKKEEKKKKYVQKTQESPKKVEPEPEPEPEPIPEPVHEEEEEPVQDDDGAKEDPRQDEEETYQQEEEERQEEQEQEQEQEQEEQDEEREIQEPVPEEKWSPVQDPILPRAVDPVVQPTQPIRNAYRPPQAVPKVEQKTKPTKNAPSESVLLPAHLQSRVGAVQYSFGPAEDVEERSPITQGAQTEPNPWPSPEPASRIYEPVKASVTTQSIQLETQPAAKLMQPQSPQPPQKPQPPRQPQPLPSQPHQPAALNTTPQLTRPVANQIQSASATVSPSLKPRDGHVVQEIHITNSPERAPKPAHEPAHYSPAISPAHSPPHSPVASPPQPAPILLNTQQPAPIPAQPEIPKAPVEESYANNQGGYIFEAPSQPIQEPPTDSYTNEQYNTNQWDDYQAPPPNAGRGSKPNPFLNFGATPASAPVPPQNQDKPAGRGSSGHVPPQLQQHKPIQPPPMYLPYPFYPPMYGPIYPPPIEPSTSPSYEMDYSKGQYDPKYYGYMYTQQPPWVPSPYGAPEAQTAHKFPSAAKPSAPAVQKFPAQAQRGRGNAYNPTYAQQRWDQPSPYPYYQGAYTHMPNGYPPHMSQQGPQ